jgi:hypothetical protein
LKDSQGHFINPSKIEENFQLVAKEMGDSGHHHLGILGLGLSKMNDDRGFMDYIHDLKAEGFFYATFGKTMKDMILDSLKDLWYMILDGQKHGLHFVLENDEGFLIIPAVVIIFATFLIGRNKFSKWIIPLWLAYFVSSVLTHTSGLMDWLGK